MGITISFGILMCVFVEVSLMLSLKIASSWKHSAFSTLFLRRLKVCDITEEVIETQGGGSGTVLIKFREEKASSQG